MKEFVWGIRLTSDNRYGNGHISRCLIVTKEIFNSVIFFTDPNKLIKGYKNVEESSISSIKLCHMYLLKKKN